MKNIIASALEFFYPSNCRSCSALVPAKKFLCCSCFALVKPVVTLYVPVTKQQNLSVYAAGLYEEPLRSMVLKKMRSDILACKQLGSLMVQMIPFHAIPCDILVPIPLHWARYSQRGYNQATEMARIIGRSLDIQVVPFLTRRKNTTFQSRLTSAERQENVNAAFGVCWRSRLWADKHYTGKHIVLVDDLYTTGATVKSAAHALLAYKPKSITVVVACRAV